jgi:hypothetical protein
VTLESRELDPFVTKGSGSAGIVLGTERTGVELTAFKLLKMKLML